MKNFLRGLLCLLAALSLEATPIEATFVGVNGAIDFGYYVGPYYGKLEQQSVVLDCVDFANDVSFGQQWSANLSHINTQSDLGNTRFGGRLNAIQLYQEAAWLTIQYSLNPSAYADIQATIWRIFDQYAPAPSSGYWLSLAQANYTSANYANFFVVTNTGPVMPTGQVQEFLTVLDPSMQIYPQLSGTASVTTPEPRVMGAVGGLLGIVFLVLRYRKRSRSLRM